MIFVAGRQLRGLSRTAAVLLWAPRVDRRLKAQLRTGDEIVWHFDERLATPARCRRMVQAMLAKVE